MLQGPGEVIAILVGEARRAERDSRQVDSLPAANLAVAIDDAADPASGGVLLDDFQRHSAVGHQDSIARADVVDQLLIGAGQPTGSFTLLAAHELDRRAKLAHEAATGQCAQPNLRSRQISQNADRPLNLGGNRPNQPNQFMQPLVLSVSKIQPKDIDASIDQRFQLLARFTRGTDRRDDFGFGNSGIQKCSGHDLIRDKGFGESTLARNGKQNC